MRKSQPQASIAALCELFGGATLAIHVRHTIKPRAKKHQEVKKEKDQLMIRKLQRLREELPGVGTRKLQHLTVSYRKKHNIKMGRDKMHELLRKEGMLTVAAPSAFAVDAPEPLTQTTITSVIKIS